MELKALEKTLRWIGLTGNEAKVYLGLLKLGSAKAGRISKESGINRTTTYDALKRLLEKGLASYVVKANRKLFMPAHPNRLLEMVKEREGETRKIVPILEDLYKKPKERQNVTLYHGYKGVKSVFEDIIREGKPNCVLDAEGQFTERMPYYAPYFIRRVEEKAIPIKHLVRRGVDIKTSKTTQVKYIPKRVRSSAVTNIYGNKIGIIIWSDPPEAVLIENKLAAESYRNYFDLLWGIAKSK
jgi:sugar-specific transcriptional regulator TrmB